MYYINILTTIIGGTLALLWIGAYTEWLASITAALGLGGALSWAAVVLRIIPKSRTDRLLAGIEQRLLPSPVLFFVQIIAYFAFAAAWPFTMTTISFDNQLGERAIKMKIVPMVTSVAATENCRVSSGSSVIVPVGQKGALKVDTGLFGSRWFRLCPSEAPITAIETAYLRRQTLHLPDIFFEAPSILFMPEASFYSMLGAGDFTISISGLRIQCKASDDVIDSSAGYTGVYRGEPLWMGPPGVHSKSPRPLISRVLDDYRRAPGGDRVNLAVLEASLQRADVVSIPECPKGIERLVDVDVSLTPTSNTERRCSPKRIFVDVPNLNARVSYLSRCQPV